MKPTREHWKAIPGHEGRYEVSDHGRVRSVSRIARRDYRGDVEVKGRILKLSQRSRTRNYFHVTLGRGGKHAGSDSFPVHRLVMLAFVGPRPEGLVIRHLNGDGFDNRLSNLKYGTQAENAQDSIRHGTHHLVNKTHCDNGHPLVRTDNRQARYCPICLKERQKQDRLRRIEKSRLLLEEIEIDIENERWLPIPGYEGEYSVSDQGRVRSEARWAPSARGSGRKPVKSRIMVGSMGNGYRLVGLMKDRKQKQITVHSLVLMAFVGPRPDGLLIRHLNDNPVDNRLVNLKYGTAQENLEDRLRNEERRRRAA